MKLTPFQQASNLGAKDNELVKYHHVEYFTSEFPKDHPTYNVCIPSLYIYVQTNLPNHPHSTPPKNLRYAPKIPP